ncbi:MAG: protein kinase, partial [Planctomycetota bacterium]
MTSNRQDLQPGDRFDKYTILRPIAEGGMGTVYHARQEHAKRDVALKVISNRAEDKSLKGRFLTEIRAVSTLDHPNIVPIYEIGQSGEAMFFTMRLVKQGSLSDRIAQIPLDER